MTSKIHVLIIFGTRPEALKCFPVIQELKKRDNIKVSVCATGQHREILDQVLALVNLKPDIDLDLMRAKPTLTDVTSDVLRSVGRVLDELKPDRILVQGDTTTTMASALAAFYRNIPVAHIEAGLRSNDINSPWPEEVNRRFVSVIADMHFAPTEQSRRNLLKENVPDRQIFVTGNTVIDALFEIKHRLDNSLAESSELTGLVPEGDDRRIILVTSHRRENWGHGIVQICTALQELANRGDVRIIFPVHPNPKVYEPIHHQLSGNKDIILLKSVDYLSFFYLMNKAYLILTDSGGIQEEAPALDKPVLVLRNTTERPEGIEAGTARLVGTETKTIVAEASRLLDDKKHYSLMKRAQNPYGDGKAAKRIVERIINA